MSVSDSSRLDALVERLRVAIVRERVLRTGAVAASNESHEASRLHEDAEDEVKEARKTLEKFLASADEWAQLETRPLTSRLRDVEVRGRITEVTGGGSFS
jgi:F0F1-type ATP synthase membrane subunit b/b'